MEVDPPTRESVKMEQNRAMPWVEKYRPNSLDELISHQDIITTINNLIAKNKMPHLLFYGPPGTGKTSTILACAKQMFGERYKSMILEVHIWSAGAAVLV